MGCICPGSHNGGTNQKGKKKGPDSNGTNLTPVGRPRYEPEPQRPELPPGLPPGYLEGKMRPGYLEGKMRPGSRSLGHTCQPLLF